MAYRLGDIVEVSIESFALGGRGVGRIDGYVIFVSGAIPGDRVAAKITKRKRFYAQARAVDLLKPSADRIFAQADHPGAPWQVLPYERQLAVKTEQVTEALTSLGGFQELPLQPIVPAVNQWRYRNKLEYSFGVDEKNQVIAGFHPPGEWRHVQAVKDCILASKRVNTVRNNIVDWVNAAGLSAFDRETHQGQLRNLVIREGRRSGEVQVRLVTTTDIDPEGIKDLVNEVEVDGLLWTQTDALAETTFGGETKLLAGVGELNEQVCGLDFAISPAAFFQTNTEMAEVLYQRVHQVAQPSKQDRLFDLCCGIGTIGLTFSNSVDEIWGLEIVSEAVRDAGVNANRNGITNASFHQGDIRTQLRGLVEQAGKPDLVVLDPPRAGFSAKVMRRIIETEAKRIVYVSCNPTTLAPNAAQLVEAGYQLDLVQPVDMFPHTPHVECITVLNR